MVWVAADPAFHESNLSDWLGLRCPFSAAAAALAKDVVQRDPGPLKFGRFMFRPVFLRYLCVNLGECSRELLLDLLVHGKPESFLKL